MNGDRLSSRILSHQYLDPAMKPHYCNTIIVVVLALLVSVATCGSRLLEFQPGNATWYTEEEVFALASKAECGAGKGFMDITDHKSLARLPFKGHLTALPSSVSLSDAANKRGSAVKAANIKATISKLSSFKTRYYTKESAAEASAWLQEQYIAAATTAGRQADVTVEKFPHSWEQPSFIVRIAGTDSDERVIVGAHIDSITSNVAAAPGADDDASGTGTILEAFRVLISDPSFKPALTVEFHGYSAEEVGLRGSQGVAEDYKRAGVRVRGMMQMDMTGYDDGRPAFVADYVSNELTDLVLPLASAASNLTFGKTECGYACSDFASWTKAGYRSVFPFETDFKKHSPYIHTAKDVVENLDTERCAGFAKVAVAFVTELSQ